MANENIEKGMTEQEKLNKEEENYVRNKKIGIPVKEFFHLSMELKEKHPIIAKRMMAALDLNMDNPT